MKITFLGFVAIGIVASFVAAAPGMNLQEWENRENPVQESQDDFLHNGAVVDGTVVEGELTEDEFSELHAALLPGEKTWRTIPWQTSLVEAQQIAAREHKPLFIWAMDGHPLGCT